MLIRTSLITAFATALFFTQPATIESAHANERMAGTVYISKPSLRTAGHHEPAPRKNIEGISYTRLESQGLLTRAQDGSLGDDLWRDSKRSVLVSYIPQVPAQTPYRTIQELSKRLLLTKPDSELIAQDEKPEPGQDITTLRIEKLLELGAYKEALELYTRPSGLPYHERFARAGILAAFYNREPALACLDGKTVENEFKNVTFWQQIQKICSHILSKDTNETVEPAFPESEILHRIASQNDFRFKPGKTADLHDLTPLEVAALVATDRLDLSGLVLSGTEQLPHHVLALFLNQPTLKEELLFPLMLQAVQDGLKTPQELAAFYQDQANKHFGQKNKTSLAGYREIRGWKRLPYLYRAAANAAKGAEQAAILKEAVGLLSEYSPEYGDAALWPFAGIINTGNPENYDTEVIRDVFRIFAQTGTKASPAWEKAWLSLYKKNKGNFSRESFFQLAAYRIGSPSVSEDNPEDIDFAHIYKELEPNQQQTLEILHEKLDKSVKLHNYDAANTYEKQQGLTRAVDYVMPSISLLDRLENAANDQRLGEVILLSSIALRDIPPERLYAGLFREVIDGLLAVGLTEEAQSLAREVILGL